MANWETISNTISPPTSGASKGTISSGEIVNLTLTNVVNGVWNVYSLSAANFKIGGGVESGTDTSVWVPAVLLDGVPVWDANANISQVAFTDTGIAGDPKNTVNVAVTLSSYTPAASETLSVGIQEKDDNPVILASARGRSLSIEARWDYSANQTVTTTMLVSTVAFTKTSDGDANNSAREQLRGTVPNRTTTSVASFKFAADTGYHYVNASTLPTFSNLNSKKDIPYGKAYSWERDSDVYENGKLKEITFTLSYTPPAKFGILEDSSISNFDDLGHTFTIPITIKQDTVAAANTIRKVSFKPNSTYLRGTETIKVFGVENTQYSISVTSATGEHYNFTSRAFQTAVTSLEAIIGGNGVTTHEVLLPEARVSTRYDIKISGLISGNSTVATLAAGVPTRTGDATITKHGLTTLTIKPITNTSTNFGALPADITVARPIRFKNSGYADTSYDSIDAIGGTSGASSTRLVLAGRISDRIAPGMLVTGNGIAHGSTVSNVINNAVTLSTASTVANSTSIKFTADTRGITPFTFTVVPNSNTLNVTTSADLPGAVGGFSKIRTSVNGSTRQDSVLKLKSTKGITPGMSVTGTEVNATAGNILTVSDVINGDTITLSEAQSFSDTSDLNFSVNSVVGAGKLHSIQANKVGSNIVITGYINAVGSQSDAEIRVYIDDIITVS